MSVYFCSGMPGDGKSLRGMMLIEEELMTSRRNIVTNLAVYPAELAQGMHDNHGSTFDLSLRLRLLTPEETMCFYFFPGVDYNIDPKKRMSWEAPDGRKLIVPDMRERESAKEPGTLFIIDEAHIFFGARTWQQNGTDGFFYLSQHRKYRDDVILITQNVGNVDKQFRSVTGGYYYMRNRSKHNLPVLGGLIRQLPGFSQRMYAEPYRDGMQSLETIYFKPAEKLWLAKCYNTAAGVGVMSKAGAEKVKKKGLPLGFVVIPFLVLALVLWYLPRMLGAAATSGMRKGTEVVQTSVAPVVQTQTQDLVSVSRAREPASSVNQVAVWCTGIFYDLKTKSKIIQLSDGRTFNETVVDSMIRDAYGRFCGAKIEGQIYRFKTL